MASVDQAQPRNGATLRGLATDPASFFCMDPEVIGDLIHEVRNFMHRLHYLVERVHEGEWQADVGEGATTVADKLSGTVRGLDQFLEEAFDYLRPIDVAVSRMAANEFARATQRLLAQELGERQVEWRDETPAGTQVLVDVRRFSAALRMIVRNLDRESLPGTPCRGRLSMGEGVGDSVVLEIEAQLDPQVAGRRAARVVERGVAAKYLAVQGGTLTCGGDVGHALYRLSLAAQS